MGALRVYNGTTWETVGGVGVTGPAGADGNGSLLARIERNATTASAYTLAAQAATADVDATNLAVTFTAPASGVVKVILSGGLGPPNNRLFFSLRTGTTNVTGTERRVADSGSTIYYFDVPIFLTGLTSGTSYTYKWAWRQLGTVTTSLYYGTTTASEFSSGTDASRGPLVMEVWSA